MRQLAKALHGLFTHCPVAAVAQKKGYTKSDSREAKVVHSSLKGVRALRKISEKNSMALVNPQVIMFRGASRASQKWKVVVFPPSVHIQMTLFC